LADIAYANGLAVAVVLLFISLLKVYKLKNKPKPELAKEPA
jgi:hypothetical protein